MIKLQIVGQVAEWFKATVLKTVVGGSSPWVRIPPCPPTNFSPRALLLRRQFRATLDIFVKACHHRVDEHLDLFGGKFVGVDLA